MEAWRLPYFDYMSAIYEVVLKKKHLVVTKDPNVNPTPPLLFISTEGSGALSWVCEWNLRPKISLRSKVQNPSVTKAKV